VAAAVLVFVVGVAWATWLPYIEKTLTLSLSRT
jgi:hypothetical protein